MVRIRNISFKRQIKSTKYVISKYQNVELIIKIGMLGDMNPEGSGAKGYMGQTLRDKMLKIFGILRMLNPEAFRLIPYRPECV